MAELSIIFIVGLTGVGKSTTLETLEADFTLLPNRRSLADEIIIPEMLRELGRKVEPIKDRVERFNLTGCYREKYEGGMVHALSRYLKQNDVERDGDYVFDNIRGLDECRAAVEVFPRAHFIFLDAPPRVRLERMVGRADAFDRASATPLENTVFIDNLLAVEGLTDVFDAYELAQLEATTHLSDEAILNGATIIVAEQRNYSSGEAKAFLETTVLKEQLLYLDTSHLSIERVRQMIMDWL